MIRIGSNIIILQINGIYKVPEVDIISKEILDFWNIYLKREITLPIKLHNTSSLLGVSFKINNKDDQSKGYGELICSILKAKVIPKKLRQLRLKLE